MLPPLSYFGRYIILYLFILGKKLTHFVSVIWFHHLGFRYNMPHLSSFWDNLLDVELHIFSFLWTSFSQFPVKDWKIMFQRFSFRCYSLSLIFWWKLYNLLFSIFCKRYCFKDLVSTIWGLWAAPWKAWDEYMRICTKSLSIANTHILNL